MFWKSEVIQTFQLKQYSLWFFFLLVRFYFFPPYFIKFTFQAIYVERGGKWLPCKRVCKVYWKMLLNGEQSRFFFNLLFYLIIKSILEYIALGTGGIILKTLYLNYMQIFVELSLCVAEGKSVNRWWSLKPKFNNVSMTFKRCQPQSSSGLWYIQMKTSYVSSYFCIKSQKVFFSPLESCFWHKVYCNELSSENGSEYLKTVNFRKNTYCYNLFKISFQPQGFGVCCLLWVKCRAA